MIAEKLIVNQAPPEHSADVMQLNTQLRQANLEIKKLKAALDLLKKFISILNPSLTSCMGRKLAPIVRTVTRAGVLRFTEVQTLLRLKRRQLKDYLKFKPSEYYCNLRDSTILASTPVEAGLIFVCIDCVGQENMGCHGYGKKSYPKYHLTKPRRHGENRRI